MKIILTGATGRVGGGVLKYCLSDPAITSLIVLSRRPLETKDPKLTVIIQKDFLNYDQSVLEQLKGAQGCVWALGSPMSSMEVHRDYTHKAIDAFLTHLVPHLPTDTPFRFVHTSGGAVPYLESKWLFFLGSNRTYRGDLEQSCFDVEKANPGKWESYVVRPWHVVDEPTDVGTFSVIKKFILKRELGAVMANAAAYGTDKKLLENEEMRQRGQALLAKLA